MAFDAARRETVLELALVQEAIRDAQAARSSGAFREQVDAAGELTVLGRLKAMLEERLAEIDRRRAAGSSLFGWLRQIWFDLKLQFESWIARA